MPSVKIPKKSTSTDMTPFVDVAFLILTFFIMATKFKAPDPVTITTPGSVSSDILPANDAVLVTMDKDNHVYFSVLSESDNTKYDDIIQGINTSRNLNLTAAEMQNFKKTYAVGVPFSQLKGLLDLSQEDQNKLKQPGIPVLDSTNNELIWWVSEAKKAFAGRPLVYLIKGDNKATYPTFDAVISALKKNDQFKYNLVTAPEDAPAGTELYQERHGGKKTPAK
jgi:biopolymer transport protein ExbD